MAIKIKTKEFLDAVREIGTDAEALSKKTGLEKSSIYYRLRELKANGRIDGDGNVIDVSQSKLTESAINREVKNVDEVVSCPIDVDSMKPEVDPSYMLRNIDTVVEKLTARKRNVCMIGDAGSGKTKLAEQLSARLQVPFLRIACDDSIVLKEMLGTKEIRQGTTYFKTGLLYEVVQLPSVILFDEFNSQNSSRLFFLHELLDNRRLLVKDADGGRIINLHNDCKIVLACNYNSAKYSGTNKTNVALGDRTSVLHVEPFDPKNVEACFNTGDDSMTQNLMKFYTEVNNTIRQQQLRMVFSLRGVNRIVEDLKDGDNIEEALTHNLFNHSMLTARQEDGDSIKEIARVIFGAEQFNQGQSDSEDGKEF